MTLDLDIVLIWVDGNDPEWQNEYKKYSNKYINGDTSEIRFRDFELLKYWFRGIEKYTPWVRKVHFVTCGHLPNWLNINNEKINFVRHSDFIPKEYLPTFNSHTIELNLHRIEGLSENFIYFNDDFFIINKLENNYFFNLKNKLPKDCLIFNPIISGGISHIVMNNLDVIKNTIQKKR
ncbi:stealth family protein [Providencia rettgeri]|uniref:stealth family protein n=1 Tax=Providencia rettgeri TaxID=587 RepID=UPI0034E09C34